ncbi:kinesin motor domain-domain-containing protein [Absidia repens]|uniref:Kinesin-like protein n=1 Tax=Absidia repens TaxID=90262 RepID=A0A1X2I8M4_9FUNG|nr:kinesin motor domain-domain-containing protein [Absidia repens]
MPPYLQITHSSEICMTPPEDSNAYRTRNRAPERYRFTKIFTENVSQQDFFNNTTLPLIKDVLTGENALIFAYGVTNSGKSYSIMGTRTDTGLLPRTLDVIFNSIKDYTSDSKVSSYLHTLIPIDGKYEYGIWVSYAEIYTERIYDLLIAPDKQRKRKSLALKYEFRSGHKYIAGLTEVKVRSIDEAYTILRQGQRNRAVFSTLMNQTSSRSHSIFTIRIVRVPIYENEYVIEDPSYAVVSKMSIVDLAGSERYRNTLNSGQRLKEAGNINKSLMVLGQCMETLRLNQLKSSMGKRRAIVPFRHSKLTELFKSSFEGDGKAVMVVNVNPTDTGFDENSHVMKFAAVAKDVATWRRIHPKLDLHGISAARNSSHSHIHTDNMDVYQSTDDEDCEDDDDDDDDDDDEPDDPFVDNLIAQWADLRDKWTDAETRCATMESTIRQQVSKEMDIELRKMEEIYMSRMINEVSLLMIELNKMQNRVQEHGITKQTLLEKIAELEKDKSDDQSTIQQLTERLQQHDQIINDLQQRQRHQNTKSGQVGPYSPFDDFLDLRKRLRRSVFKSEEYSSDADEIMTQVEKFKDVTFDMVKESNMGKLLKLISQRQFQQDSCHLKKRAERLLKRYIKLSISTLAPPIHRPKQRKHNNRESLIMVSVDAGKEEDLISDMRDAMDVLQDENRKLKSRLKVTQINNNNCITTHYSTFTLLQ